MTPTFADVQAAASRIAPHAIRTPLVESWQLNAVTGGRVFPVHSPQDLNAAIQKINRELRNQYVIGYSPSPNPELKGKWHKLKVHLNGEPMKSSLHVYARKGYYAGSD